MAWFLAVRAGPAWRVTLLVLVIAPFWTSQLLRYYAWMMILGSKGIPAWLDWIGLADVRIINTPWAVLIGAVYGYLPLMIPPIYVSLEKLDRRLLEASADLGAPPARTFWQITLPLALPGVATGAMLVFILLMGDYILPQFLGGGKVFFIGNALVDLFLQSRNWPFGAAVAISLVAIMFVTVAVYMRFVLGRSGQRSVQLV
jgi:spermidine/putrescine transport system permease protein